MSNDPFRILMVVTSHGDIDSVPTTGIWFSEFDEPYRAFLDAGAEVTVASPRGGPSPVDPRHFPSESDIRSARTSLAILNTTTHLSAVRAGDHDGIFFPGGHGPMFDLATDPVAKSLVAQFWQDDKPVAAVCHGPAALLDVVLPGGRTLLRSRNVTGFSAGEDEADALFAHMPFSLQARMEQEGARFSAAAPQQVYAVTDGNLVTGQNPASALATAAAFLDVLAAAGAGRA